VPCASSSTEASRTPSHSTKRCTVAPTGSHGTPSIERGEHDAGGWDIEAHDAGTTCTPRLLPDPGAERSERFGLAREDAAADLELNEVIWRSIRGLGSPRSTPRRAPFERVHADRARHARRGTQSAIRRRRSVPPREPSSQ